MFCEIALFVIPAIVLRHVGWLFGSIIGKRVEWKWTVQLPAIIVLALFVVGNLLPTLTAVGEGELAGASTPSPI